MGGDLHSLVVHPGHPTTVFAGGHQAVSVSHDGGRTWQRVSTLDDADAMGWAFLDDVVAVGGHPGLSVSEDGGQTFARRNEGLPATDIHALGGSGNVLYAASPALGVISSGDAGATWELVSSNAGQSFMGPILVDASDPDHLLASDMAAGAVESRDGGRSWGALGGVEGAMWVTWDIDDPLHIIASGMSGAAETRDGGETWEPLAVPVGVSVVEMSPTAETVLYAAAHQGSVAQVWVSEDGGETWLPTVMG